MAFTYAILADMVIRGLYESQALWNKMNRSFDGLVSDKTATSVKIPRNPTLVASKTAVAKDSASRKGAKGDTDDVDVPFGIYTVPMKEEIEAKILTNGKLLNNFIMDANDALSDQMDADVIAEAQTTDNIISLKGSSVAWDDIIAVDAKFNELKVPRNSRLIVIPTAWQSDFMSIDVVKQAMAFNKDLLEKGIFVINNTQFYLTSLVNKITNKNNMVGIYSRGLAVVLKGMMTRDEVYDTDTRTRSIDFNTGAAMKLMRNQYAVVCKEK